MTTEQNFNVALLTIGNEVLSGIVLDTNAHWLTSQIVTLGANVLERMTIKDDPDAIDKTIHRLLDDDISLIITSGGLGPTFDDITVKSLSDALGIPLELNIEAKALVAERYLELFHRGRVPTGDLTPAREKMAWLPQNAKILKNTVGSAPGVLFSPKDSNVAIMCLPGVPSELKAMFEGAVIPWIEQQIGSSKGGYAQQIVWLKVRDESLFSPIIDKIAHKFPEVYIKSMARAYGGGGILRLWVSCRKPTVEKANHQITEAIKMFEEELGVKSEPDDTFQNE